MKNLMAEVFKPKSPLLSSLQKSKITNEFLFQLDLKVKQQLLLH